MNTHYLMQYTSDYTHEVHLKIVKAPSGRTWRELQQMFDPEYLHSHVKFYSLGSEIKRKENE